MIIVVYMLVLFQISSPQTPGNGVLCDIYTMTINCIKLSKWLLSGLLYPLEMLDIIMISSSWLHGVTVKIALINWHRTLSVSHVCGRLYDDDGRNYQPDFIYIWQVSNMFFWLVTRPHQQAAWSAWFLAMLELTSAFVVYNLHIMFGWDTWIW